ncbi:MAG: RHS repeat-associated core domain-containing protein [Prevotellaceae bacterium]|jgi:RHS repeat-associated protein|nr:RHS repeat-associated core domain-containing protein [Prevotellaceae bacterium]
MKTLKRNIALILFFLGVFAGRLNAADNVLSNISPEEKEMMGAALTLIQMKAAESSTVIQDFIYSLDPLKGVMNSRKDNARNITETFGYDNLNRLTSYTRYGQATAAITYGNNGNITAKTDAGTLEYNIQGKPFAITKQTGNPAGGVPMRQQDVSYTGFARPSSIAENSYKTNLTYGPGHERNKMEISLNNVQQYTRHYLGGIYEKDVPASGTATERLYVGGTAYNAPAVYIRTGTGAWTLYYIHRDHLGSITALTNSSGTKTAEYSFDPWGRQRNPANQQVYAPDTAPALFLGRGFTGHEHLPQFGLINMNARLYDPILGRFLSPDPYVQMPDFTQNFNRYSYCLNNPLVYTDESGEVWWLIPVIVAGVFAIGNTAVHAMRGESFLSCVGAFFQGAVTGFALGCVWQFSPLIPLVGQGIQTVMTAYAFGMVGLGAVGIIGGAIQSGLAGAGRGGEIFLGNFYLDENHWLRGIWQGFTRHTWEILQQTGGHGFTQIRNAAGKVDRVDFFGGATFATDEKAKSNWGITLGNYCNMRIQGEITGDFDDYVISSPLYMHEYGHTIQSRQWGIAYLFAIGISSLISAGTSQRILDNLSTHDVYWTETQANRRAAKYFKRYYGVDWETLYPDYPLRYPF